jgi:hypothetical protein
LLFIINIRSWLDRVHPFHPALRDGNLGNSKTNVYGGACVYN